MDKMADETKVETNAQLTADQAADMLKQLDADIEKDETQLREQLARQNEQSQETKTKQELAVHIEEEESEPQEKKAAAEQKKGEDGKESLEKIQEDIKHLEKGIQQTNEEAERLSKMSHEEKIAHFTKLRKEKRREYTQKRQEMSEERKVVTEPAQLPAYTGDLTPKLKQDILADLDKDPVETIDRLLKARLEFALDRRVKPLVNDWESDKAQRAERREDEELAELSKNNTWMLTEGLGRFDKVFEEKPWLKQSPTPYKDALRFMDDVPSNNGKAPGSAQAGLPILGSSGAIPPSDLGKSAAVETSFKELDKAHDNAIKNGDFRKAAEIEAKIGKLLGR